MAELDSPAAPHAGGGNSEGGASRLDLHDLTITADTNVLECADAGDEPLQASAASRALREAESIAVLLPSRRWDRRSFWWH